MPFKSKAQRRKFAELLVKGEISPDVYEEWNRETGRKKLPERVTRPARKRARKPARRARRAAGTRAASTTLRRSTRRRATARRR